ncbi:MAG: nucleotidyltransferase family protein [Phycisphaerales bacterium]|nr:nucleotidyltransferase family protein [Phycisphaerales bacterium]
MPDKLTIPPNELASICRRHNVARLSLFGSVLRDDFRPDSDVDVLVEFHPGQTPGYIALGGLVVELEQLLGRPVDLHTPRSLSEFFREQVLREAQVQYAA